MALQFMELWTAAVLSSIDCPPAEGWAVLCSISKPLVLPLKYVTGCTCLLNQVIFSSFSNFLGLLIIIDDSRKPAVRVREHYEAMDSIQQVPFSPGMIFFFYVILIKSHHGTQT